VSSPRTESRERAGIELSLPPDWIVQDGDRSMIITDPKGNCVLEVSYMHLPPRLADALSIAERLRALLASQGHVLPVRTSSQAGIDLAWADFAIAAGVPASGRAARGRWLLAGNGPIQVFIAFYYRVHDTAWAVPAWERIVATLRLGDGAGVMGFSVGPRSWTSYVGEPTDGDDGGSMTS